MLTLPEIRSLVNQVTYKPNWVLNVHNPLELDSAYLQVSVTDGLDSLTLKTVDWKGSKHRISKWMCKQEIIGLCFKAIKDAEDHEMREFFRYKGRSIFNPHIDPDALVELASKKENFNCRENAMSMKEDV